MFDCLLFTNDSLSDFLLNTPIQEQLEVFRRAAEMANEDQRKLCSSNP